MLNLNLFNKNGVFVFSLLKYLEFVFVALTSIVLARQIGAIEMGFSIPVFLYITYSNYLCLGVNQVLVKRYGLITELEQDELFRKVFHLISVACICSVLLAVFVLDFSYAFWAAGVSVMVFLRSYFLTYYRLKTRMFTININSITYAFLFFILTITCVSTFKAYLICWNISLLCVLLMYFIADRERLCGYIRLNLKNLAWNEYKSIVDIGVKLSFVTILTTIFLTNDKFFVNKYLADISTKGSYQLGDNIGTALYMVITTIMYYYYPFWMVRLKDIAFRKLYIKRILYGLLIIPLIVCLAWLVTYYLAPLVFPAFKDLDVFVPLLILYKSLIIVLSTLSAICIVFNKEMKYVLSSLFVIITMIGCNFLLTYVNCPLFYIPLFSSLIVFIYVISLIINIDSYVS